MINIKNFIFNPFSTNCFVVWDSTGKGVIIDPCCYDEREKERLFSYIESNGITPEKILLTHGHFDHIYAVNDCIRKYSIPVYMNEADKYILDIDDKLAANFGIKAPDADFVTIDAADGDIISYGENSFKVITTPGHTPGGVCYYDEANKVIFTGDTLFAGSIGRTDGPGGDYDELITGIMDKIMGIDGDVDVVAGHGGHSSISQERTHNPFLQPFNEPEQDGIDWDADGIELNGLE